MEDLQEIQFKKIATKVIDSYYDEMDSYFRNPDYKLNESDVIMMVMNMTVGMAKNIYFSLKDFMPDRTLDFDFMRAKIINTLSDEFNKITEYNPKKTLIELNKDQLNEIVENGHAIVDLGDGNEIKVTEDDIYMKQDDAKELAEKVKKDVTNDINSPKIITSSHGSF